MLPVDSEEKKLTGFWNRAIVSVRLFIGFDIQMVLHYQQSNTMGINRIKWNWLKRDFTASHAEQWDNVRFNVRLRKKWV